ncbi:hypothetical protein GpartN1_g2689.t1 [Galdieria partita]|uniref:Uncharacterized protein n=1 Tax=Galdieria partita TaxID=83374 RepID=A0A9C7UPI4_9RHOD|nr:hypothetical protein GpartN1_g2689.t1 [Galdieria partita]
MSSFTCFSVPHRSGTLETPKNFNRGPSKTKVYEKLSQVLSSIREPCHDISYFSYCDGCLLNPRQKPLQVSKGFLKGLMLQLKQGVKFNYLVQLLVEIVAQSCFRDISKGVNLLKLIVEGEVFKDYIELVNFFYNINIYCHFLWSLASCDSESFHESSTLPWCNLFEWLRESVVRSKSSNSFLEELGEEKEENSMTNLKAVLEQVFLVFCSFSKMKFEQSDRLLDREAALRCILSFVIDPNDNMRHELVRKMEISVCLECIRSSTYLSTNLEALTCRILCIRLSQEMEPEFFRDYLSMNNKIDMLQLESIGGERTIIELFTLVHSFRARRLLFSIILHILSSRLHLSSTSSSLYEVGMTNVSQSLQEFVFVLQNRLAAEAFPYVFRRCPRNFAFDVLRHVFIDSILFDDDSPQVKEKIEKPFVVEFFLELERTAIEYQGVHVTPDDESIAEVENEFWVTNPVSSVIAVPFEMPHEIIQRLLLSSSPWDARFGERHLADAIAYSLNTGLEPTTIVNLYKNWLSKANNREIQQLLDSLAHIFQHLFILFRELGKEPKLSRCMNLSLDWFVVLGNCCQKTSGIISCIIHFFDSFLDFLVDWREFCRSDADIFKKCDCVAELVCLGYVTLRPDCISSLALKSLSPFAQMLQNISQRIHCNDTELQTTHRHVEWKMWKHVRLSLLLLLHLRGMPIEDYLKDSDPAIRKMSSFILTEFPNSVLLERSPSQLIELISQTTQA